MFYAWFNLVERVEERRIVSDDEERCSVFLHCGFEYVHLHGHGRIFFGQALGKLAPYDGEVDIVDGLILLNCCRHCISWLVLFHLLLACVVAVAYGEAHHPVGYRGLRLGLLA